MSASIQTPRPNAWARDDLRIQGISVFGASDWTSPRPQGRRSQFFAALARQVTVNGVTVPELTPTERAANYAFNFRPNRDAWIGQSGFNQLAVRMRNRHVRRDLERQRGRFNAIFQFATVCSPCAGHFAVPYAIYTDNTMALTQRHWPKWARLTKSSADAWMQFEARVCRGASVVFTFSEFCRTSVIDDYMVEPERVRAVGAGANQGADLVEADPRRRAVPTLLFVGEEFERKGGYVLLEAFQRVRDAVPDARLVVAGINESAAGGLPAPQMNGVDWKGHVDRATLDTLYRQADVFVMPSLFEPWGHVLVEAMAYGLPCVAANCCATPEIVVDRVTGRLVRPADSDDLAVALIELLQDPATATRLGTEGYRRAQTRFAWDTVVERIVERL